MDTRVIKNNMVIDGNEAAAYVAYAFSEIAAIYPITPSSPMAEHTDKWAANGRKNLFGQTVKLVEMQSEAGAIGAVHGALEAGSLSCSFTSSQGLMLMLPVMHRIAGSRLPAVLHVASRALGTHALSIFGDHSDVMNCRPTGFAMLSSGSVQEVMDLAGVAHLAAISSRVPFLHFFDGFRTSHEIQKIDALSYDQLNSLLDRSAVEEFRRIALNPEHPTTRSTVQNPDIFFQFREAANPFYNALPETVARYLRDISRLTGRDYRLFNYYGAPDAERVIVAMGSVSGAIRETVEYLNAHGEKTGYVQVHLYRPFSLPDFRDALPRTVQSIAVLDRCKEPGSAGEPLYQDVCAAFANCPNAPLLCGGRYGLSSKDTDPTQIKSVFDMLRSAPRNNFTIGIIDDVTNLSLPSAAPLQLQHQGMTACKFWGLGSDGTVGANKNSIKIIGQHTDMYAQAYFEYDTKKSFGLTRSHLRFGHSPILSSYLVKQADLVACHQQSYLYKYDMLNELKDGGVFLLNCGWNEEELADKLPAHVKCYLSQHNINFYIIDANSIAAKLGLGNRASIVLQAAFFSLARIIPVDDAVRYMKEAVEKTFHTKGQKVVEMNIAAVDGGISNARRINVPASWSEAKEQKQTATHCDNKFVRELMQPINALHGDELPVSALAGIEDGVMPPGSASYEKRGISHVMPRWNSTLCLQCNRCSLVCPHAVIRPYLLNAEEATAAPEGFKHIAAKGGAAQGYEYSVQISELDCTGCGSCVAVCHAKEKALEMTTGTPGHSEWWQYALDLSPKPELFDAHTVKGSQFRQPLLEFSGACSGCGETPYAKLLTQLYGDRMYWANATGCSQAWGAPMPSFPYTTNRRGFGPAWSNSLFENNAEFSLGMCLAVNQQRSGLRQCGQQLLSLLPERTALHDSLSNWLKAFDQLEASRSAADALIETLQQTALTGEAHELAESLLLHRDQLAKKSIWMFGGDGWAYDIGYGGLDHVVSLGEDVNVFVVDTELYSNTGGQSSKATPLGSTAQFASAGKTSPKKDLGRLMMSYGNCYVASVAMGADYAQLLRAITEAESFPGPSVIIAYTPCISHGLKAGMHNSQEEMKRAVAAGYWTLYRFDPRLDKPFQLDSAEPQLDYEQFLRGETRYAALDIAFPDRARELFAQAAKDAMARWEYYKKLAE